MAKLVCAYCKGASALTHEHLWPASLHSRLVAANQQAASDFWLARLRKSIPNEPQIRDVCAKCNNGILSELDAYICSLFDNTFIHIPLRNDVILFEYEYHSLKRWLLKMCFNSARIHNSADLFALEALVPYILEKRENLGRSVQLFLQLSFPQQVPAEDIDPASGSNQSFIFQPQMNRVGFAYFVAPGIGKKLMRAVHLRSYSFFLAFWQPGRGLAEQIDFADVFTRHLTETALLKSSQAKIKLKCNGAGAWDSFKSSRDNQFVFDADT
jgi:hypothetical protein